MFFFILHFLLHQASLTTDNIIHVNNKNNPSLKNTIKTYKNPFTDQSIPSPSSNIKNPSKFKSFLKNIKKPYNINSKEQKKGKHSSIKRLFSKQDKNSSFSITKTELTNKANMVGESSNPYKVIDDAVLSILIANVRLAFYSNIFEMHEIYDLHFYGEENESFFKWGVNNQIKKMLEGMVSGKGYCIKLDKIINKSSL